MLRKLILIPMAMLIVLLGGVEAFALNPQPLPPGEHAPTHGQN